jgi:hypothetical protein
MGVRSGVHAGGHRDHNWRGDLSASLDLDRRAFPDSLLVMNVDLPSIVQGLTLLGVVVILFKVFFNARIVGARLSQLLTETAARNRSEGHAQGVADTAIDPATLITAAALATEQVATATALAAATVLETARSKPL